MASGEITQTSSKRKNSIANALSPEDYSAHNWYRFVLSYPPHLVQDYLRQFNVTADQLVLDPFCGTGTTIVECKKSGISSIGVEAFPISHFASSVKSDWSPDPDLLWVHAQEVAETTRKQLEASGIDDDAASLPGSKAPLRKLPDEIENLLLANSISQLPLHKSLILLEILAKHPASEYFDHQRLALAKALVTSISNLRFGPEVGVTVPKADAPVITPWLNNVREIVDDLRMLRWNQDTHAAVHLADSRSIQTVIKPDSIDAVITSPPYPNEKDYTRTTRLEAVLLGFITSKKQLQAYKRTLLRSNTRTIYKGDSDDQWIAGNGSVQRLAHEIEARRIELKKTSGFEKLYGTVTRQYFGGMAKHLANLRTVLRPGAHLAYVVGDQASYFRVLIRTGELLAEIANSLGYEVVSIDLFRTRLATATKAELREEVLVLRWPG